MTPIMDTDKNIFFGLLNLIPVYPEEDYRISPPSPEDSEDEGVAPLSLLDKNNSIQTGYENFHLKKGNLKLYPTKDFDFTGQHVVCQKCYQKFASKLSYKAHVGTDICATTNNGPNLVYLKYKNRSGKRIRKKNKCLEDLNSHDIKKNLLNPEMLNTLQTRNKCYSDVVYQRNKVKEKRVPSPNDNDEPPVKKPRGRPRKNFDTEPKKRGRPKKLNTTIVDDGPSLVDNKLNDNLEDDEPVSKKLKSDSTDSTNDSTDDTNNNISNNTVTIIGSDKKTQVLSSSLKNIFDKFWSFATTDCTLHDEKNKKSSEIHDQTISNNDEEKKDSSVSICNNVDELKSELDIIYKQFEEKNEFLCKDDLELMLTKLHEKYNEFKQAELKKTDMNNSSTTDMNNSSTTDKGKENIQCSVKNFIGETEIIINRIDFDKDENCIEILLKNDRDNISIKRNEDCETIEYIDEENMIEDTTNKDSFENHIETFIDGKRTVNCNNLVNYHLNNVDINFIYPSVLACRKCHLNFASIAEYKMHCNEHMTKLNKRRMCKICGHKFKEYKNYINHINIHEKIKIKKKDTKKKSNMFECKICQRQYNYLKTYHSHIKTHK